MSMQRRLRGLEEQAEGRWNILELGDGTRYEYTSDDVIQAFCSVRERALAKDRGENPPIHPFIVAMLEATPEALVRLGREHPLSMAALSLNRGFESLAEEENEKGEHG